jgi:uncharacterized protein
VDPVPIIERYYEPGSKAHWYFIRHARAVARKALEVALRAGRLGPDPVFLEEAAMLHDIGIFLTHAPHIGCHGERPYICHGYLGRELLEKEGLPRHALVCERHVGVGLTAEDIRSGGLPLPEREMTPESIEERIVCFADKFFSKDLDPLAEKPLPAVRASIARYGADKLRVFDGWLEAFGY